MVSEITDISEHVRAICELVGKEPSDIAYIAIKPTRMRVRVYERNENGSKYIHRDESHPQFGYVAQHTESFVVRT